MHVDSEATAFLESARAARASGDVGTCLIRSVVAHEAAEAERDVDTAFWALMCAGNLYLSRSEPLEALRWFEGAVEYAGSMRAPHLLPLALHDLYLAQAEAGFREQSRRTSLLAFEAYQEAIPRHPHVAGLVADLTLPDLYCGKPDPRARKVHAEKSLRLYQTAVHCAPELNPKLRMYSLANIIRATGILRLESRYSQAWIDLRHTIAGLPCSEGIAASLIQAGEGARSLSRFEDAHSAAVAAEHAAETRGETVLRQRAALLKERAARESPTALPVA